MIFSDLADIVMSRFCAKGKKQGLVFFLFLTVNKLTVFTLGGRAKGMEHEKGQNNTG